MTNLLPLTTVYPSVFTRLNLRTIKARLLAFVIFVGLLSVVAMTASSAVSVSHLLSAPSDKAARAIGAPSSSFVRYSATPLAHTATDYALNIARRGHTATLLTSGKILIAGGENQNGFVTEAEIFDPATGASSVSGNLNVPRADHSATVLSDGRVLIAGGRGAMA